MGATAPRSKSRTPVLMRLADFIFVPSVTVTRAHLACCDGRRCFQNLDLVAHVCFPNSVHSSRSMTCPSPHDQQDALQPMPALPVLKVQEFAPEFLGSACGEPGQLSDALQRGRGMTTSRLVAEAALLPLRFWQAPR